MYARTHVCRSPLIRDYYARRASLLLEQALADARAGKPAPDGAAVLKLRAGLAYNFTTAAVTDDGYPLTPAPGYVAVAAAMRAKYAPVFAACDSEAP